jgi:N-acetylneuraminate synthase
MIKISEEHSTPKIIAEIGCNHKGSMDTAKELISAAAIFCKADVVKLQKRTPRELLTDKQYQAPHPNPIHAYGATYGAHREFLEFGVEQHREIKGFCENLGIVYSTSVWDLTAATERPRSPNSVTIPVIAVTLAISPKSLVGINRARKYRLIRLMAVDIT